MPALTPQVLFDLETQMRIETESAYDDLNASLWYDMVARTRSTQARRELVLFLLSTAQIHPQGDGGNVRYDDLVSTYIEMTNKHAGTGLKLRRDQLEDTDGGGMALAAQWSSDVGQYMRYWPQQMTAAALKGGESTSFSIEGISYDLVGYDTKALFAADHPLNPFATGLGVYHNIFTGGAGTDTGTGLVYPGACPIDDAVDLDDAFVNLTKIFSYIRSIRTPNAVTPRGLRPRGILCGPRMYPRVAQLTSAKFIAQVAGSGAGSADVEAVVKALGFAQPVEAPELAGFESDTTFFVVCEQLQRSKLGALVYLDREPFSINYYTGEGGANVDLARSQELEWLCHGRNGMGIGHPFLIFKCKGS